MFKGNARWAICLNLPKCMDILTRKSNTVQVQTDGSVNNVGAHLVASIRPSATLSYLCRPLVQSSREVLCMPRAQPCAAMSANVYFAKQTQTTYYLHVCIHTYAGAVFRVDALFKERSSACKADQTDACTSERSSCL